MEEEIEVIALDDSRAKVKTDDTEKKYNSLSAKILFSVVIFISLFVFNLFYILRSVDGMIGTTLIFDVIVYLSIKL
jgi:hypothetical protein